MEQSNAAPVVEYAGFAMRLRAFSFDFLIIAAYIVVLALVNFGLILGGGALDSVSPLLSSPLAKDALAFLTLILPVILYFTLQESSPRQATWGKRKVGIRVVGRDGGPLTRTRAFVRSLLKFLPWQIAHTCLYQYPGWPSNPGEPPPWVLVGFAVVYALVGLYVVSALIAKDQRTLYDRAAGSAVVVGRGSAR